MSDYETVFDVLPKGLAQASGPELAVILGVDSVLAAQIAAFEAGDPDADDVSEGEPSKKPAE